MSEISSKRDKIHIKLGEINIKRDKIDGTVFWSILFILNNAFIWWTEMKQSTYTDISISKWP